LSKTFFSKNKEVFGDKLNEIWT